MTAITFDREFLLSVVIPCYNEERTLSDCIDKVIAIQDAQLHLEIIIVDDCSSDNSFAVAKSLARKYDEIKVFKHDINQGKGAALRTGFKHARGEFVVIQDADNEYDSMDIRRLDLPPRADCPDCGHLRGGQAPAGSAPLS